MLDAGPDNNRAYLILIDRATCIDRIAEAILGG
jgi:hypothetical protein